VWPRALVRLLILGVLAGCASGGGPSGVEVRGGITGSVRTQEGRPVPRASVALSDGVQSRLTVTDEAGTFAFADLPTGSYRLTWQVPIGFRRVSRDTLPLSVESRTLQVSLTAGAVQDTSLQLRPGSPVTLGLESGGGVEIGATSVVTVTLETTSSAGGLTEFHHLGRSFSLTVRPGPGAGDLAPSSLPRLTLTLWQRVSDAFSGLPFFVVDLGNGSTPLSFFVDGRREPHTDESTGLQENRVSHSVEFDVEDTFEATVFAASRDATCGDEYRSLRPLGRDAGPLGERIPLVLIHGWQATKVHCEDFRSFAPESDQFRNLIDHLFQRGFDDRFKIYIATYPTLDRVLAATSFLGPAVAGLAQSEPAILIGHSMGGLTGRGIAALVPKSVKALITLGTPHNGAPLAELAGVRDGCESTTPFLSLALRRYCLLIEVWKGLPFAPTNGVDDLRPGRPDQYLGRSRGEAIHTLGGRIPAEALFDRNTLLWFGGLLTPGDDDGIVPVGSALPEWTIRHTPLTDYDHFQMARGRPGDTALFEAIATLLEQISTGSALSGTIVQQFTGAGLGGLAVSFDGVATGTGPDGSFSVPGTPSSQLRRLSISGPGIYPRTTFASGGRTTWQVIPRVFDLAAFNDVARVSGRTARWTKNPRLYVDTRAHGFIPGPELQIWINDVVSQVPALIGYWSDGENRLSAISVGSSPPKDFSDGTIVVRFEAGLRDELGNLVSVAQLDKTPEGEITSAVVRLDFEGADVGRDASLRRSLLIKNVGHMMGLSNLEGPGPATILVRLGWWDFDAPTAFDDQSKSIVYTRTPGNTTPDNDRREAIQGTLVPAEGRIRVAATSEAQR